LLQRFTLLHDLDVKHRSCLHQTELIRRDEDTRRLKIHRILLRDDIIALHDMVSEKEEQSRQFSDLHDQVLAKLTEAEAVAHDQGAVVAKQSHEIANLQVKEPPHHFSVHPA
jgi:hypothetical protein